MRLFVLFLVVLLSSFAILRSLFWAMGKAWFWKRAIRRFEESALSAPPKPGAIVFTGSSSIHFWKSLAQDMAPLRVVNRGFGGSHMAHVTHYARKIVLPYSPSAVVIYAGENDVSWPSNKTPETVLQDFKEFVDLVRAYLPAAWIYFISIKPTPRRWKQLQVQQRTNQLVEDFCRTSSQVQFVDVSKVMLDAAAKPRRELFRWDGLHPSAQCYSVWRSILRPILMARFAGVSAEFEKLSAQPEQRI